MLTSRVPDAKPLDHLACMGAPDAPALVLRSGAIDYQALNLRVGRLSHWLISQGLAHGDRVATWLAKTEIACLMPLATARAGLVHVPVNPLLKAAQAEYILADSGAKLLVSNKARLNTLPVIASAAKQPGAALDSIAALAMTNDGYVSYDESDVLVAIHSDMPCDPASAHNPDDLAAILYTSGSTGRPKGVMLSHRNMWLGAESVRQYLKLAADDVTLCVLPLSFDYGQNQLLSTWAAGACAVPLDFLTANDVIKAAARHKVTTLAAVPPLWVQLVEANWPAEAVAPMRRLTNSGGALTPQLVTALRGIFASADIYAMYGLTEAFRSTYLDPALLDGNPVSMGKAIPFAEIMVVTDEGGEAAVGEEGELVHAGPLVAHGYWQDATRTAERFKPAPDLSTYGGMAVWSGDRVRRDADGLLYFVGRRDAMIKSSGNRISPMEIESVALDSGLVAEAIAVGVKDERLGQAIVLFVRGQDNGELATTLKRQLPNFMVPHHIIWLDDFPKNANGKLDRNRLIEEFTA